MSNSSAEFSTDWLRVYYDRLFPYEAMFNWLSYGNDPERQIIPDDPEKDYFSKREWSFTIEDDIYIRYQSFRDKSEMKAAIQKRQPHKIDIGAIFSAPPKDHTTVKPELFKTVERELVFDIDMTDYDSIRTCCTGANICLKCWPYMTMAVKTVDVALRQDFGFSNILWIYSGRRGVHCWVCDDSAKALSNEARSAVVEYMSVEVGSAENSDKKTRSAFSLPLHPHVRRSYDLLEPYFERCIASEHGQGILCKRDLFVKILNSLPDESIRVELYDEWDRNESLSGIERWRRLKAATTGSQSGGGANSKRRLRTNYAELESWRVELVLTHTYPRLDANVSKAQNHLLKSPFCVHPKTGRVCVPIDPATADAFNPFSVPTLRSLIDQINEYDKEHESDPGFADTPDTEKTSMKHAMETFNNCFMRDLSLQIRRNLRDKADQAAAMAVDF